MAFVANLSEIALEWNNGSKK